MGRYTAILGRRLLRILFLGLATAPTMLAAAEPSATDRVRLDRTVISGNQELPKVLYLVPWHDSESTPVIGLDPSVLEFDVFRRLDPQSHRQALERRSRLEADAPAAP